MLESILLLHRDQAFGAAPSDGVRIDVERSRPRCRVVSWPVVEENLSV